MNPIEKAQIDEHIISFYSDKEERHYKLSEYKKQIVDYAQKIYTDIDIETYSFEALNDMLSGDYNLHEFNCLFTSQNDGLIYFKGKSRLIEISLPLCRDFSRLKNGIEIEYSLYNATFENGIQGKTLRNFTFSQKKPVIGEVYEFEYTETKGKYNPRTRTHYTNKSIKIILPKKAKQSKTKTHGTLI